MWHMCRWCSQWILGHSDRWIHARWMSLRPNRRTFFPQSVYIPMIDGLIPFCSCLKRWYLHMFLFQNVDFTNSHSSFSSFTTFHDKHSIYIYIYCFILTTARQERESAFSVVGHISIGFAMELPSRAGAGDEQDGLGLWRSDAWNWLVDWWVVVGSVNHHN